MPGTEWLITLTTYVTRETENWSAFTLKVSASQCQSPSLTTLMLPGRGQHWTASWATLYSAEHWDIEPLSAFPMSIQPVVARWLMTHHQWLIITNLTHNMHSLQNNAVKQPSFKNLIKYLNRAEDYKKIKNNYIKVPAYSSCDKKKKNYSLLSISLTTVWLLLLEQKVISYFSLLT